MDANIIESIVSNYKTPEGNVIKLRKNKVNDIFSVAGGDTCHGEKTPSGLNARGMKSFLNAVGM
jgi:hypothetical protein